MALDQIEKTRITTQRTEIARKYLLDQGYTMQADAKTFTKGTDVAEITDRLQQDGLYMVITYRKAGDPQVIPGNTP